MSEPSIERMVSDLLAAGWRTHTTPTHWIDPQGNHWRGPFGAWKAMKGIRV